MKIAINGFGRIGRLIYRILADNSNLEVVAINDLANPEANLHLFKYDSVHGTFGTDCKLDGNRLVVGRQKAEMISQRTISELPWKDLGVDIVMECTGLFTKRADASKHLENGAKKVVISAPAKEPDATFCYGINHEDYDPSKHNIISNASCTTNCLAPLTYVLDKVCGIERGLMTTIHSYTNDQRMLDQVHKDLRRARAGAVSMIPTTTGAAAAIGLVMPQLKGKFDGFAVRVPTPNVSIVDLSVTLSKGTDMDTLSSKFDEYAGSSLNGILKVNREPLVSKDFNGSTYSSVLDLPFCRMSGDKFAKLLAWYDNEYGYSMRVVDLCEYIAKKG